MGPSTLSTGRLLVLVGAVLALLAGVVTLPKPARAEAQQAPETPTIEFQPMCWVNSGATPPTIVTVKIVGHSFAPNVKINVQDLHNPQTFNTASTDPNGMFTSALNVSIVQGGNTIRVSDAAGEHDLAQAVFNSCTYGKAAARLLGQCSSDTAPTLHVVGTDWAASPSDALIEILIDGNPDLVDPIPPPSNGNFDVTRVVAKDLSPGDHSITFNQNGYQGSVQVVEEYAQGTLHIGSDCPQASVTPACAPSGASPDRMTLTLTGTAFDPTTDLHVVFDPLGVPQEFVYQYPAPPTPDPFATGATPAPPSGDFGPISIDPFARAAGDYVIELIQRDSGNDITRDWVTTFRSPCLQPTLATPSPDCGDAVTPGVEQEYSITVTGTDFVPDQGVTIVFDPDDAAGSDYPPTAFTGTTDANGGVYAAISPGYRPPGYYRILAYQDTSGGHFEASTTFNVPCIGPPISPPPTLPPGSAVISVNPTCAPVADGQPLAYTLSLTGGGFQPGPVTVVLDPDGTPFTGTVEADVSGYVSASFVADGKAIGTYRLQAYQDNNGIHIEADTTLTVPCQTVTINPTCAAPADGLAGAYAIVASGIGFDPGPVDLGIRPDRPGSGGDPGPGRRQRGVHCSADADRQTGGRV